jgi:hypothetical protein
MRLAHDMDSGPSSDDLLALADAVREAASRDVPLPVPTQAAGPTAGPESSSGQAEGTRRGHLQSVPPQD